MKIKDIQDQIVEEFDIFDSWMDKYEYLIELGKSVPVIDDSNKIEENIIKGCQSKVWLHAEKNNGLIEFYADSDAIIVKGLIALVLKIFDGASREEIKQVNISELFKKLELDSNIAGTRRNGLASMIEKIKTF